MRALWLALALAACGSSTAAKPAAPVAHVAAPSESVRITRVPPAVGDRRTLTSTMIMDVDTTGPDGSTGHAILEEQMIADVEVLEVAAGTERKVKVAYPFAERKRNLGDLRSREDKPVKGHTYVVWVEGRTIHAMRDDGAPMHPNEEKLLVAEWSDDLGRDDELLAMIAGEPWTLGARRELSSGELAKVQFGNDEIVLRSGSIALTASSDATATFELDVVTYGNDTDAAFEVPAHVTVEIDRRSGRPMSLTMTGAMNGTTSNMKLVGTVSIGQRWTYP